MSSSCCSVKPPEKPVAAKAKLETYRPLIIVTIVSLLMGLALSIGMFGTFLQMSMGAFLTLLSLMKLFNISGFAMAFAKYDPLAKKFPVYAKLYPFIEMALGLLYFAGIFVAFTNIATIIILGVTTIGVIGAIRRHEDLQCGCAGTAFALPVGRVTVFENAVMILMALVHFLHY